MIDIRIRVLVFLARPRPKPALELVQRRTLELRVLVDKHPFELVDNLRRVGLGDDFTRLLVDETLEDLPVRGQLGRVGAPVDYPAPAAVPAGTQQPLDFAGGGEVVPVVHFGRLRGLLFS